MFSQFSFFPQTKYVFVYLSKSKFQNLFESLESRTRHDLTAISSQIQTQAS